MGKWRGFPAFIVVVSMLASCGGSEPAGDTSGPQPVETTTVDTAAPAEATSPPPETDATMPIPAEFPAPFLAGGGFTIESPDEIQATYPAESYDAIIDFYQQWSLGQSVRLIDSAPAYEWRFSDFSIFLEPDGDGYLVTVRRAS